MSSDHRPNDRPQTGLPIPAPSVSVTPTCLLMMDVITKNGYTELNRFHCTTGLTIKQIVTSVVKFENILILSQGNIK